MGRSASDRWLVLLVEDDRDISSIVEICMRMASAVALVTVHSAGSAIDLLRTGFSPDLLLVDVNLPDMDGLTLARTLNAGRRVPIPVAFLTASVRDQDRRRYDEAGAICVISKPFDPIALPETLEGILART